MSWFKHCQLYILVIYFTQSNFCAQLFCIYVILLLLAVGIENNIILDCLIIIIIMLNIKKWRIGTAEKERRQEWDGT